jgi:aryl-alcohol dehydrogenase-like predicted oxidoreductase
LKNPNVSTVITGASKVSQVEENFKCLEIVDKLDEAMMKRIEEILGNKPSLPDARM